MHPKLWREALTFYPLEVLVVLIRFETVCLTLGLICGYSLTFGFAHIIESDVGMLVAYPMLFGYGPWSGLALNWVMWRFVRMMFHYSIVNCCSAIPSLWLRFLCLSITNQVYHAIIYKCEYLGHIQTIADHMWTADHRCEYEPVYDCRPTNRFSRFIRADHSKQWYCFCMTIVMLYCVDWI